MKLTSVIFGQGEGKMRPAYIIFVTIILCEVYLEPEKQKEYSTAVQLTLTYYISAQTKMCITCTQNHCLQGRKPKELLYFLRNFKKFGVN